MTGIRNDLMQRILPFPKGPTTVIAAVIVAIGLSSCSNSTPDGTADDLPFFPKQKASEDGSVMQAQLFGRLVNDGGCLRVESRDGGVSYLIVWRPEHSVAERDGEITILDGKGDPLVKVGDTIYTDGGEVPAVEDLGAITGDVAGEIDAHCDGPYWLIGVEMRSDNDR